MKSRVGNSVAIVLVLFVAAWPAAAQQPSPEAMAAAKELIAVSRAADQFKTILPLIAQQLKPAIVQGRPEVERDYDKIMPIMTELALKHFGSVTDDMAAIYAGTFSAEEMRQVTAFYRTPVGQKFLDKVPDILQQSMVLGQKFAQRLMQDFQKSVTDELRKRGHNI